MHPRDSAGRTLMEFRRTLAAATLALTAACATTSQVKPEPVATAAPSEALVLAPHQPVTPEPPKKERDARELFAEAVAAFDAGDYARAEEGFRKVLEQAPQSLNSQFNLGIIAERQGRLADAQAAYEKVRSLAPGHVPTLLNLGRIYRVQEKYAEAIALYEAGLKVPGREHASSLLNNLTVAYRLAGKHEQAEATARRVLARNPDDAEAYKNLALVYYDQGKYRLAELVLANARKLDEKDPGIYNNLGMIYLKLEDRARALTQFQKAVSLNERFAPGYINIGAMALAWRDYAGAERSFAKAVELEPGSQDAWLYYAYALDGQKGRDAQKGLKAGEAFEKVLALRADQPDAVCGAGWAYAVERTGWDKAEGFLQRCKELGSTSAQDKQMIDAKLQGIAAMRKSGQPQPAPEEKTPNPAAVGGSGSMLDKVSDEAARQEGAPSGDATPAAPVQKAAQPGADTSTSEGGPAAEPPPEAPKTE
ncbi:tetratricopeptide repeat protein [Vitiosangium sp. GDMCC 1.1324]|uniref:tetratricopeptide repeat protein n=1 Tax=Vitiosangium sp. (strain GDMCC 1.1324) TaxID=2138576 RepID=UPI000D3D2391|nr:tetratricopeptide repeat protein [Vitiosangium sp. GDMCC 1.1324]PTL85484.1 gliding motility protein [Vitiosangium sp. GDMCC 1.1324]